MPSSGLLLPDIISRLQGNGCEAHDFAKLLNERQHDIQVVDVIRCENRHKWNWTLGSCTHDDMFSVANKACATFGFLRPSVGDKVNKTR